MRPHAAALALLLLLALIANAGWLDSSFPLTHEFFAPVYTLADFDTAIRDGNYLVNWLPNFAGGGQPVFNFYPPLAYYLAWLFHLAGLSFPDAIRATFIAASFASGAAMYLLAHRMTKNPTAGFAAAAAYIFFPYHLVDSHLRGDLAESVAFVFFPLVFLFLRDAVRREDWPPAAVYGGIAFAALILSHILMGYIFGLFVLLYAAFSIAAKAAPAKKIAAIVSVTAATGLALSAFYWLPALAERQYVNFDYFTSPVLFDLQRHYLHLSQLILPSPWAWGGSGPGAANTMPLALGLFSLLVLACAIILVARRRAAHGETAFFLIAALLACFLTLDLGLPILALLPSIEIIQFPWRFLAVAAFAIAVLAGLVTRDLLRYHRYAGALLLCLILITSYPMAAIPGGSMGEPGDPIDPGVFGRTEYLPVRDGAAFPRLPDTGRDVLYAGDATVLEQRSTSMTIETRADEPLDCNVRIFFFPRWRCTIDGVETAIRMQTDGSILFSVPAGTHTVELAYADSAISLFAKALSAAGLAGAAAALVWERRRREVQI